MQGCDLCLSFKFPKFSSYRKKSLSLWFGVVSLKEQQWKNRVSLDFLLILRTRTGPSLYNNMLLQSDYFMQP